MNYRDTWAEDEDGNQFVFTVEMKRSLAKAGFPIEVESLKELQIAVKSPPAQRQEKAKEASKPASTISEPDIIQIDPESGKYLGTLKWYNPSRGYGFISRGGGEDIFFHKSSSTINPEELSEGQWVLYDVEERSKGPEATDVEPYEGELVD